MMTKLTDKKRYFYPLALLFGALPSLPLMGENLYVLGFFLSVPLLLLFFSALSKTKPLSHARITVAGFLAMYGYFLSVFRFLFGMYPLAFIPGMTPDYALLIVLLCWLLLSFLQALLFMPAFLLLSFCSRAKGVRRRGFWLIPLYAALYTAFEWLQNFGWFGVPWGGQMLGQVDNAFLLQTASLFGAHYITYVLLTVNGCLAYVIRSLYIRRAEAFRGVRLFFREGRGAALLCAAVFLALNLSGGAVLYYAPEEENAPVSVGLVQANHAALDKTVASNSEIWEDAKRLALDAIGKGATVLLYSETVLTVQLSDTSYYSRELEELSREHGVTQIVGAFYADGIGLDTKLYNSLFFVSGTEGISDTHYDKRHLVPFGEYLPMPAFFETVLPFVCELMRDSEMNPGMSSAIYDGGDAGRIGGLICFDSIYPELTRESVLDGATWLALGTNDSWFTGTEAIRQHLSHARLRAVESRRYVARTAATGRSAVIDTKGSLVALTNEGEATATVATLVPQSGLSVYTVIGDLFPTLCLLSPLYLLVWELIQAGLRRKKKEVPEA